IGILPSYYAITNVDGLKKIGPDLERIETIVAKIDTTHLGIDVKNHILGIQENVAILMPVSQGVSNDTTERLHLRAAILQISTNSKKLLDDESVVMSTKDREDLAALATKEEKGIRSAID